MNKIVPILSLCLAILTAVLSVVALIAVIASITADFAKLVSLPTAIVCFVASAVFGGFAFMFKKDILCRIAFFIDLGAFTLSVVALILWIVVM